MGHFRAPLFYNIGTDTVNKIINNIYYHITTDVKLLMKPGV